MYVDSNLVRLLTAMQIKDPALSRFLRDARIFVASSHDAIELSAPHIYLSALPFADRNSLLYRYFSPRCTGLITADTFGVEHHGGNTVTMLTGHSGPVRSVAYSPDGLLLASGSEDGSVRIWDMRKDGEAVSPLRSGHGSVISVDFARNDKWVASGTEEGVVCIWNITPGQTGYHPLIGHSDAVNSVVFAPDSSRLASASDDMTARLWNPETGEQLVVIRDHTDKVNGVAFSPDGEIWASVSDDDTIRQWDISTGQATRETLSYAYRSRTSWFSTLR